MRDLDRSCLRHNAGQDRLEKPLETVLSSQRARPSNPPANQRKSGENNEWNGHRWRRFVDMFLNVLVGAGVAEECKQEQPKYVKSPHPRSNKAHKPQRKIPVECLAEDFIFAEESGERKNSRNRQRRDRKGLRGDRNLVPQTAHLLQILFPGHRVNHTARAEEQ